MKRHIIARAGLFVVRFLLLCAAELAKAIMKGVTIVGLGFVALYVAISYPDWSFSHRSPIAANASRQEFDRRVKTEFPLRSPETAMIDALTKQGFAQSTVAFGGEPKSKDDYQGRLVLSRSDLICGRAWIVFWQANAEGQLLQIEGQFHASCL